jgi:autotransporter-associated beta strand protein
VTNAGIGTLTLSGVNTYSGGLTIAGGTVKLNTATAPGRGAITLSGGTLAPNFAATTAFTNPVVISGSGTIAPTITSANLIGPVTGTGNLTIGLPAGFIYNLAGTGAGTQFAGFSGSIGMSASTTSGTLKLRNDSGTATDKGLGNVALDLGTFTSVHLSEKTAGSGNNSGSVTQTIGSLSGGGATVVEGADASSAFTYTLNVGGLNTDAEFDGVLGLANRGTLAIVKSGTGRWTLGGVNVYFGATTISNGVLALGQLNGFDGSIANSAVINIKSGASLDVTGRSDQTLTLNTNQRLSGQGTLAGSLNAALGSTISPGDSLTNGIGTLTTTASITLGGQTWMKLNRINSPNSDRLVSSVNSIIEGGTLVVTNIGARLQAGDTFTLFSAGTSGSFASIVLPNYYTWNTDLLAASGQISVATVLPLPAITNVNFGGLSGGSITLNAVNGAPGGTVIVLTSTNLSLPLSSWTPVVTNAFDGNGNLNGSSGLSIPVPASSAQQFFTLRVF